MEFREMFGMKPFNMLTSPVKILLSINTVVFALSLLGSLLRVDISSWIVGYGALIPEYYTQWWRYITYAFIHVNVWHFLFNMLALWMFGDDVALFIGYRWFWGLYLFSAVFAALFSIPFYLVHLMNPYALIIGASGALMGIFVAYAKLFPDRMILLFFVIPMKISHAIWFLIVVDILLSHTNDSVAHFTHLGGVLAGFICMYCYRKGISWSGLRGEMRQRREATVRAKEHSGEGKVLEGEVGYIDEDKELNMILEKVGKGGVNSLTESEKTYLIEASKRRRRGGI